MISCSRDDRIFRFAGLAGRDHWTRGTAGFTDLVNLQQSLDPPFDLPVPRRAVGIDQIRVYDSSFQASLNDVRIDISEN